MNDSGVLQVHIEIFDYDSHTGHNPSELIDRFVINVTISESTERKNYPGIFGLADIDVSFFCTSCEPSVPQETTDYVDTSTSPISTDSALKNTTESDLVTTEGELMITEGELMITESELMITEGELMITEGELMITEGELMITEGELMITEVSKDEHLEIIIAPVFVIFLSLTTVIATVVVGVYMWRRAKRTSVKSKPSQTVSSHSHPVHCTYP